MRNALIRSAALGLLLLLVSTGVAQTSGKTSDPPDKKKEPTKLEELLAQALRHNPDIRVAEAKVHEAEAQLARTRLEVAQKVVTLVTQIDTSEKTVEEARIRYEQLLELQRRNPGSVSQADLRGAELNLQRFKAELAVLRAQLPYLLGKGLEPERLGEEARRLEEFKRLMDQERRRAEAAEGLSRLGQGVIEKQTADNLRAILDKRITFSSANNTYGEVFDSLSKTTGLRFQIRPAEFAKQKTGNVDFGQIPLSAVLEWLEDASPQRYHFVIREYGLLFCPADEVPPGAILLRDFRKARPEKAPEGANPPQQPFEGVVKSEADGLVKISVGADAGLAKGHTLEVFRTEPQPEYVGRVVVVEVSPKEAVCRPTGRFTGPIRVGDRVAPQIQGR
jgi:hypothetical protein